MLGGATDGKQRHRQFYALQVILTLNLVPMYGYQNTKAPSLSFNVKGQLCWRENVPHGLPDPGVHWL